MTDTPAWIRRFRAARVSLPTWAADAPHRLVYATNASGVWQVMSWDLERDDHRQITDKETGVLGGRPTPDGSGVVWFDDRAGDEVGRYVVSPFDGGPPVPYIPDLEEGWSAGLSVRPHRQAVGVSTSDGFAISVRDGGGVRELYRSPQPAGVGGLSKDAEVLAISHTERGDVMHPDLRLVDAATGRVLLDVADGLTDTVSPAGWSPIPGDQRLALLCDHTGRTRPELLDVGSGDRTPLELDLPGEVYVADWWPDASALLLGHDHLGRTTLHRYELDSGELRDLDLTTGSILGARVRDDGALWYAFNSSATPSQIRVRDDEGDRRLLTPPGDPAPEGVAYRSLHYDNGEGQEVHAFLAVPEEGEGPHPIVVDVHGGPSAQETDTFVASVQAWVDHGYAVLLPNYRGSTGYGKAWEDTLQGDPGRPELIDVLAGLRHVIDEGIADPERTVLTGGSWGGYLTLQGIGTQPDAWKAAIAIVPVADYIAAYADEAPVLQEFDRTLFGGTPDELPDLYRERSPITYVDQVTTPVLIITGANDTRCPKRQVDNYVAALERAGVPHAYDVFEAGHGSYAIEETIRQQALALDFAAEHLGTQPAQR
jgi:dipeptidyl aminopeptidase/acylaminoacyl peptidase